MEKPKISIIIPVYNTEKYLEQCLSSLLSQTYSNLEIICVNDGSTDNSLNVLEGFRKLDNRIIVVNQKNLGQSSARNQGASIASGDWITFVDSDDWLSVECYEEFYKALQQNDFEIFMFNGASFSQNENDPKDVILSDFFTIDNWNKFSGEICSFKDCKNPFEGNLSIYNKIYSSKFIKRYGLKFEPSAIMEDELYWIEAFLAAKRIYLCDKIFYFYRQQKGSTLHNLDRNVFDIFPVFRKIRQKLVDYNCYNQAKYAFLQHKFRQFAFYFFAIPAGLRDEFFANAKADLEADKDFDIEIIKRLKDNPLYFAFLNMSQKEFFETYKNAVRG